MVGGSVLCIPSHCSPLIATSLYPDYSSELERGRASLPDGTNSHDEQRSAPRVHASCLVSPVCSQRRRWQGVRASRQDVEAWESLPWQEQQHNGLAISASMRLGTTKQISCRDGSGACKRSSQWDSHMIVFCKIKVGHWKQKIESKSVPGKMQICYREGKKKPLGDRRSGDDYLGTI